MKKLLSLVLTTILTFNPIISGALAQTNPVAKEITLLKRNNERIQHFFSLNEPFVKTLYTQADNIQIAFEKMICFHIYFLHFIQCYHLL